MPDHGWHLRDMEREIIRSVLQETNNKSLAAKIACRTLIDKLKEYNLES